MVYVICLTTARKTKYARTHMKKKGKHIVIMKGRCSADYRGNRPNSLLKQYSANTEKKINHIYSLSCPDNSAVHFQGHEQFSSHFLQGRQQWNELTRRIPGTETFKIPKCIVSGTCDRRVMALLLWRLENINTAARVWGRFFSAMSQGSALVNQRR